MSRGSMVSRAWTIVRLRRSWGLGVGAAVFLVAVAAVFLSRPIYRADARLRLGEPPPAAGISPTGGLLSFLRTGGDPFANDLELLASRTLASAVVSRTALSADLRAPRGWTRDSVLVALSLVDTTAEASFRARWTGDRVRVTRLEPEVREEGELEPGVPGFFGGMRVVFRPHREGAPEEVRLRTVAYGDAVRSLTSRLAITRTRRDANVLEVSYTHSDPGVARSVVAAAVEEFLRLRTEIFQRESGETVDSLRVVSRGTQDELRAAEDALEAFQRSSGLVALDPQSAALVDRYEAARTALEEARAERETMDAQMSRVREDADGERAWSTLAASPRFLENQTVGELLLLLTELRQRRTALVARLQPDAAEIRTLEEQIQQLDGALRALVLEYRTTLGERIDELSARVAEMERLLAALPSELVEFGRRQREVRLLSELVVLTEQRLRQEELRQALAYSNVQLIDEPRLRYRPVWPRKKLGLAVGLLFAAGAGVLAMVTVHRADPTLWRPDQIRAIAGAPVVAVRAADLGRPDMATELFGSPDERCVAAVGSAATAALEAVWDPERDGALHRIGTFAEVAAAVRSGRPVILVVSAGATSGPELESAIALLTAAGSGAAGVVAVFDRGSQASMSWG